eukprot:gene11826-5157_t
MKNKSKVQPKFVNRDENPEWSQDKYIQSGYRIGHSFKDCLFSLFTMHNETINIWTAIFSLLPFLYFMYEVAIWEEINIFEKFLFMFYTFSASYCFTASTLFHWFGAINENVYTNLIRMDMSGIALLTGGSYIIPLYYGFYCDKTIATFYVAIVLTLTIVLVIAFLTPDFSTEAYRGFRLTIFSAFALFGVVPIVHMYTIYGLSNGWLNAKMTRVLYMYLIYACGALFYLVRIPERLVKFKFDHWFHSHHFWHLFVFLATYYHYLTCHNARDEVMKRECYNGALLEHYK